MLALLYELDETPHVAAGIYSYDGSMIKFEKFRMAENDKSRECTSVSKHTIN
jgi:hypothetical protein